MPDDEEFQLSNPGLEDWLRIRKMVQDLEDQLADLAERISQGQAPDGKLTELQAELRVLRELERAALTKLSNWPPRQS